jgi:hypothetical protein
MRWRQLRQMSRFRLTPDSRHLPPCLILDVRQEKTMTSISYPDFATQPWYRDYSDPRCPHDAWLESLMVREVATGERSEVRRTEISIRLLDAYHEGSITFLYSEVSRYEWSARNQNQGHGDFLSDDFEEADGYIIHRIHWERSDLTIVARSITYQKNEK